MILEGFQQKIIEKQNIFEYERIQNLIDIVDKTDKKPYPKLLWAFYVFQLWYEEYIEKL